MYQLGKTGTVVGVLISNKSIRDDIVTKIGVLKKTRMGEVKRNLFRHGFIKIGSCAPDTLLRDLYENTMLVCGVIDNHNPDTLLYNYLYAKK